MQDSWWDVFFLNPQRDFCENLSKSICTRGFEKSEANNDFGWKYKKGASEIIIDLCQDESGPYIVMNCINIVGHRLWKELSICPECGSNDVQIIVLYCWKNEYTEKLYKQGKLDYGLGAYDRMGTRPETHRCLKCGCKWHNGAAIYYWNESVNKNNY